MALPISVRFAPVAAISLLLAVAGTTASAASNVTYDFAGAEYVDQNLDDFDCSQDGVNLYGNKDIDGTWFGRASLSDYSGNGGCGSTQLTAGGGYRTLFNDIFDVYGTLSLEHVSPDFGGSDTGLVLAGGFRGFIAEDLETKLELAHHTTFDGTTAINATGIYWFHQRFSGTAGLSISSEDTSISIGARMKL